MHIKPVKAPKNMKIFQTTKIKTIILKYYWKQNHGTALKASPLYIHMHVYIHIRQK